jgi:hypothetical protein
LLLWQRRCRWLGRHLDRRRAGAALVGTWTGGVEGIGGARLVITAVKPSGQLEGRMEFDLQSFVSKFGDAADDSFRLKDRGA